MSSYLDDDSTVFTTLCIGNGVDADNGEPAPALCPSCGHCTKHQPGGALLRERLATQLQSILKFTHHDCYVITDHPEAFGNYFGPRIHFIKFNEKMTDLPLTGKRGMFNYNLKMVPIKWTMENVGAPVTVYLDADTFLFGWDRLFYRFFPQKEEGIWGRFRHALNDSDAHNLIIEKIANLGVDGKKIDTRLPVENVMFFKQGPTMSRFFESWYKWAKKAYDVGARTDFEAIEMALAIHETDMPYHHLDNSCPYVDNFRTLHHGRVHIPFVI
jgi:hypothetical protein